MLPSRHAALLVSVTVMAVSLAAAPAAAATNHTQADTTLSAGDIVWQGQTVAVDATPAVDSGGSLELRTVEDDSVGAFVAEVAVDGNGTAVLSTETLDAGSYVLTTDGTPVAVRNGTARTSNVSDAQFQVTAQTLSVSASGSDGTTALEVSSNRQQFPALVESETLTTAQLEGLFGSQVQRTTADGVVVEVGTASTLQVDGDTGSVDSGEYDIDVSALDTGVEATATVTVTETADGNDNQQSPTTDAPSTDPSGETDTEGSGTTAGGGPGFTLVVGAPAVLFAAVWRYYR